MGDQSPPYRPYLYIPKTAQDNGEVRPLFPHWIGPFDFGLTLLQVGKDGSVSPVPGNVVFAGTTFMAGVMVNNGSVSASHSCVVDVGLIRCINSGLLPDWPEVKLGTMAIDVPGGGSATIISDKWVAPSSPPYASWILIARAFDPLADPLGLNDRDFQMDRHIGAKSMGTWAKPVSVAPLTRWNREQEQSLEVRTLRLPQRLAAGGGRIAKARVELPHWEQAAAPEGRSNARDRKRLVCFGLSKRELSGGLDLQEIRRELTNEADMGASRKAAAHAYVAVVAERQSAPILVAIKLSSEDSPDGSDLLIAL